MEEEAGRNTEGVKKRGEMEVEREEGGKRYRKWRRERGKEREKVQCINKPAIFLALISS
jgi:hypothetical protein